MKHNELDLLTVEELAKMTYTQPYGLATWLDLGEWENDTKVSMADSLVWFVSCIESAGEADNAMLMGDIENNRNSWLLSLYGG